ncbi:MAG: chemotaxis protein CheW, partial [Pseudomonadota bacterium]|nr:chemotaxis protein CheW [Pseudomonadota bacterium]
RDNVETAAQIAVGFLDPKKELGLKEAVLKNVLSDPKGIKTDNLYPVIEELNTIQEYMTSKMGVGRIVDLDKFVDLRFADVACKDDLQAQVTGEKARVGAQHLAAFETGGVRKDREGKYLTFDLGDECYGINIMDIREIIGLMAITPLPNMPSAFKGVINLRDKVIPVMDMRNKFGLEEMDYHDRTCIIVIEVSGLSGSMLMGGIVDSVSEVLQVMEKDIEDPPKLGGSLGGGFILGIAKTGKKVTI